MRLRLKGIASATKKLANGTSRKYFYAWRGGPQLPGRPGSSEFVAAYNAAVAARHPNQAPPAPVDTIQTLIDNYRQSAEYPSNKSTAKNYEIYLRMIETKYGTMPITVLEDPRVRGDFKKWRDTFAATARKADYLWQTLARVFSHAKDHGQIKTNPCERGGRLYASDRKDKIWTDPQLAHVLKVAPEQMVMPIELASWTGQRQGDLLKLTWSAYDGAYIRLMQSKTKKYVEIPVGGPLKILLDAIKPQKATGTILRNSRGAKWTSDGFRTSWGDLMERAGMTDVDLHFHDLRGTAVTNLAVAGCTIPEIASITGHSPDEATKILAAHYLGTDRRLAAGAMKKLEEFRAG